MTTYDHTLKVRRPEPMIQKYRKKPVEIEAVQWKEENIQTIKEWLGDNLISEARYSSPIHWIHRIKTLEGNMLVTEGDYIIKGVKGEFYPCKQDIFEMTYESALFSPNDLILEDRPKD